MIDLLRHKPEPNYSLSEITNVLENRKHAKVKFIKDNWNTMRAEDIAIKLNISLRNVFKLTKGQMPKKKHIVVKPREYETTLIIDLETGIYYSTIAKAALANTLPASTLRDFMSFNRTNRFKRV
jgi:hypothetical protein